MVTALMVAPQKHPCPTLLCDDGDYLSCAVSRDLDLVGSVSVLYLEDGVAILFCRDADWLLGTGNRKVGNRILAGTFYIVGYEDGRLISLTDEQITRYTLRFWETELYSNDQVFDSWIGSLEEF